MINGLEGIPGSGKSYEASVFQVLAAVKEGRKVITNLPLVVDAYAAIDPAYRELIELRYAPAPVRGTWNAERLNPETGQGQAFELFADGHVEKPEDGARVFGTVWCYWSDWKHPITGRGPLYIVDECHVAMPKIGTPKSVIEWYKLHRHFNGPDVVLATQKFRQMSQDIAELMAMVIKVRKADILGRPTEYIRKVHAGYRGAVIQEGIRQYEKHFFTLYKSHTQGNAVLEAGATDVLPLSIKLKRWTRGMWVLAAAAVAFAVYVGTKEKPKSKTPPGFQSAIVKPDGKTDFDAIKRLSDQETALTAPANVQAPEPEEKRPAGDPEPYGGKTLHLTGLIRMGGRVLYTFAVAGSGAVLAQVTSDDLVKAGYEWEPLTECAGYLRWRSTAQAITCDAPARQVGSPDRPIVMRDGYSSDGKITPTPKAITAM